MEHNSDLDRSLIGDFVEWYLERSDLRGNKHALARRARYSARTVHRITSADESVSGAVLIATSKALGLGEDALIMMGRHDIRGLVDEGSPASVIRWVESEVKSRSRGPRAAGE